MKKVKTPYTARTYRSAKIKSGEKSFQVILEESDLWISCRKDYYDTVDDLPGRITQKLREARAAIKAWMRVQPEFGPSLVPVKVSANAPQIVQNMARGAERWNVGPMAAVAGAVAEEITRAFMDESPDFLVENGGDIFMASTKERTIALLPDPENGASIGIKLAAGLFPMSICSSSSTIGHSLSFGQGELVTVLARDASMADAAATHLCNNLKSPKDLEHIIKEAEEDPDIIGLFAQCGSQLGLWGDIELVVINNKD